MCWPMLTVTPQLIEEFWKRVDQSGECWLWTGSIKNNGYGRMSTGVRRGWIYAHRFSAMLAGHDIDGLMVRHKCDNPPCVRPTHLEPGTAKDNVQDMLDRGRNNPSPKLTDEQVFEARTLRAEQGLLAKELAARYGVATSTMFSVLSGRAYGHVPMPNADFELKRKTQCVNGHDFATYGVKRSHQMICRLCDREYKREWSRKQRRREQGLPIDLKADLRRRDSRLPS